MSPILGKLNFGAIYFVYLESFERSDVVQKDSLWKLKIYYRESSLEIYLRTFLKWIKLKLSTLIPLQSQAQRKTSCERDWFFACQCLRCRDPSEFSTFTSCVRCLTCRQGFLLATTQGILDGRNNDKQVCNILSNLHGFKLSVNQNSKPD